MVTHDDFKNEEVVETQENNQTVEADVVPNKELAECQQQMTHWKEQYVRIAADFDNFKKRADRERSQTSRIIKGSILLEFFPIVDNFERALATTGNAAESLRGFEMIYKELCKMLKKQGVEEIAYSKAFDPELYEAIMTVPSENHTSGEVVAILQKGYTIDGAVVRPAQVSVAA